MAKISTYPILSNPTANDILIGTDVEDLNITKNFSIGSIIGIIGNQFVPYVGATGNVNLGAFNITASSFIVAGGTASQFLKANGTLDSTVYVPASRTLTINSVTFDLSANRSWDLNTINSLTTTGTTGPATYIGKTLNIPQYQAQGNYITQLSGEATAMGPGNATVTLSNLAVISKILTGLNITGGTIVDTDSILTAFGKVQNQLNGLTGGVTYQGTWNAATNTPTLTSSVGTKGYYYVVNVAGSTNLNGITDWKLGDWAIFNGSTWEKVDNTDAVVSVNGYTGAVVLTFSDVGAPPATRNLTINGVQFDLTADRTWTVGDVRTDQSYANPSWITAFAWSKITGTPTTLAGYGITDGVSSSRTLTINGVTYDLTANRTWNVGTVTSIGTSGPLTGGTITGSGTIGITQAGASSDGYLSSTDWNTFNNKQNALTNPVTGTGTIFTLPMWSGATSLVDSPLSYGPDAFNFQYNSATGGTVNFTNIGLTSYTYSIQMNNFGSPRSTVHSYTDGLVVQSIAGTQVSRMFANGNLILGTSTVETGHKLTISGDLFVNTIINAVTDTDRFIVSDGGIIKYRTGAQLLSDIGAQGSLTLTTTGTSGAATLIGNTLNIPQYTDQFVGTVTSVGLSMPIAFTVSNSPVTSSGTLTVVGAGTASQYVRGDGTLGDFPGGGGGGGSSVSYYLNSSVSQGTIGGVAYRELSKVPILGAGTDISINADGYIASYITDAGDPNLLEIPAGNWNFETYFSASSGGGTPTFYVELYKVNAGGTATLIASNSGNPEFISLGTNINPYFSALAVPQTTLASTDRLAVRYYVTHAGRTITLHTENGHLCQIITTFTTGLTALNGLTAQVQYFQVGTSGTDFNIASATATHTFNLPTASAVNRGALSSSDWAVFNGKQNAITLTTTGTTGSATLIGSTLNIPNYSTDLSGYVTLDTTQTITGLKTILRGGDVLNFKIGTDTIYGLKVAYNQNELVPSGEATWSFVNTFNRNGSGFSVTPLSFFRGVLVTGERLLSASVNTNLLDYYANNPTGRYPIYAYNTGVQQFASSIIVGETNGVVDAITGSIADLPAGVVANFKGRVIGSDAVNNNEFATLGQVTSTSRAAISLTTTGTSGPATYSSVTGVLNIPEYQGGVTSFNTRTGAVTLTSSDVTTALGYTPVTDARTLSINGVTYDLTANRSWTVGVNPSAREIQTYIATASQTTFTVTGGYTVGLVDVYINGVRLTSSDYTATNGTTVVLTVGTMAGNIVDIIKYTSGIVNSISGSGTTNELAYFTASTTISSLTTATYPSLTELSYVKGVTSSIQTQLNGKQNALTNPVTGTGTSGQVAYFTGTSAISSESNLFWDATNDRFGIGTNTPSTQLNVGHDFHGLGLSYLGSSSLPLLAGIYTSDGTAGGQTGYGSLLIKARTDFGGFYSINFFTSSSNNSPQERMRIFSDGNVFIGSSPSNAGFKLDVNGTGRFSTALTVGPTDSTWNLATSNKLQIQNSLLIGYTTTGTFLTMNLTYNSAWKYISNGLGSLYSQDSGDHVFFTSTSSTAGANATLNEKLRITNAGNVGIGTASPSYGLDIASSVAAQAFLRITKTSGAQAFLQSFDDAAYFGTINSFPLVINTNGSERMRITSGGNVGIGTTNPLDNLVVSNAGANGLHFDATFSGGASTIYSYNRSTNAYTNLRLQGLGLTFLSGASTSMTITTGGNVGIGTANATGQSSDNRVIQIYGAGSARRAQIHFVNADTGEGTSDGTFIGIDFSKDLYINNSEGATIFENNGSESMRITSGRNVLIGTTTDTGAKLNVMGSYMNYPVSIEAMAGGGQLALTRGGAVAEFYMGGSTGGGTQLYVRSGGSGGVRLDAGSTGWVSASDIRLKDIKNPIENAVESLSTLQTVYYSWKDSDNKSLHIGLIAQEVEKVFPELVSESSIDGMKGVNYTELIPVIIKAIQELNKKINV
jgi:hypothetical protein